MPTPGSRPRADKTAALANNGQAPRATKADPLVDVSFLDLDAELIVTKNGKTQPANGDASADVADAISRVRRRRAAAGYNKRVTA